MTQGKKDGGKGQAIEPIVNVGVANFSATSISCRAGR